jgi:hypothetical protein
VEQAEGVGELRRAAIGTVLAAALCLIPAAAYAHNAGRVELLVTNLKFAPTAGGTGVRADLIDRDSGDVAAGFAIVVTAREESGAQVGPVTMLDPQGSGHYEGVLVTRPGAWTVTAKADQGSSALPALGSSRTVTVNLDEKGAVTEVRGQGGGSDTATWLALTGAGAVLALGAYLLLAHKNGATSTPPIGQRVAG